MSSCDQCGLPWYPSKNLSGNAIVDNRAHKSVPRKTQCQIKSSSWLGDHGILLSKPFAGCLSSCPILPKERRKKTRENKAIYLKQQYVKSILSTPTQQAHATASFIILKKNHWGGGYSSKKELVSILNICSSEIQCGLPWCPSKDLYWSLWSRHRHK